MYHLCPHPGSTTTSFVHPPGDHEGPRLKSSLSPPSHLPELWVGPLWPPALPLTRPSKPPPRSTPPGTLALGLLPGWPRSFWASWSFNPCLHSRPWPLACSVSSVAAPGAAQGHLLGSKPSSLPTLLSGLAVSCSSPACAVELAFSQAQCPRRS